MNLAHWAARHGNLRHMNPTWPKFFEQMWASGLELQPWQMLATGREFLRRVRNMGAFELVNLQTTDADVMIKLL